jgi:hypothetical protein
MKKLIATLSVLFAILIQNVMACEVCEKNQPKVLQGITHGTGPEGNFDYFIIWTAVVIVLVTMIFFVKFLIWPKEEDPKHIKRNFINEN